MNWRMHHLRRMATTAWAKADIARDAARECFVQSRLQIRAKDGAKEARLMLEYNRWKSIEARLIRFGQACHAEACRITSTDPSP